MKKAEFRILVSLVMVVGLVILNSNFQLPVANEEEGMTTCVVEEELEIAQQAKDESTEVLTMNQATEQISEVVNEESSEKVLEENSADNIETAVEEVVTQVDQVAVKTTEEISEEQVEVEEPLIKEPLGEEETFKLLTDSLVTSGGGYATHAGKDTVNVFAEEVRNAVTINTAVSYNIWGLNVQEAAYSTRKMREEGNLLTLQMGMESGSKETMTVEIYVSDPEIPDFEVVLEAANAPVRCTVDISKGDTLRIVATNHADVYNRVVLYDFELSNGEV